MRSAARTASSATSEPAIGSVRCEHHATTRTRSRFSPRSHLEQVLSGIDTSEGCSVKDSFAGLGLAAAGFRPLFRAHWLTGTPLTLASAPLEDGPS